MARSLVLGLLLVVAALLQVSVLPLIAPSGFVPDLLLLAVIVFASQSGVLTGVRMALPAGLLADLLSVNVPLGLTGLVFLGVAWAVGRARSQVSPESLTAPIGFVAAGTFAGVGGYGLLSALLARESATLALVSEATLVATLYAILLAPAALWLGRTVDRSFPLDATQAVVT